MACLLPHLSNNNSYGLLRQLRFLAMTNGMNLKNHKSTKNLFYFKKIRIIIDILLRRIYASSYHSLC